MCPSRLLAEPDGVEADEVISWWLHSSPFNGFGGQPSGPPEWPLRGGLLKQPGKLVDAVKLLRSEHAYVVKASDEKKAESAQG